MRQGAELVRSALREVADPDRAAKSHRYFQAFPGGYGESDQFLGVTVPGQRAVARQLAGSLDDDDLAELIASVWHEERLVALFVLVRWFERADPARQAFLARWYLGHLDHVDNWDLVDSSAPHVLGAYLLGTPYLATRGETYPLLEELADSESVWRRRVAVLATQAFIRADRFDPTLVIAGRLLGDRHDLIHKAVGWMLREIGERDLEAEECFLIAHQRGMPRTMLRYAIEKFEPGRRGEFMKGTAK